MTGPGLEENLKSQVVSLVRKIYRAERAEMPLPPVQQGRKTWGLAEDLVLLSAGSWPRGTISFIARELGRSAESCRQRKAFQKRHGLLSEQSIRDFYRTR